MTLVEKKSSLVQLWQQTKWHLPERRYQSSSNSLRRRSIAQENPSTVPTPSTTTESTSSGLPATTAWSAAGNTHGNSNGTSDANGATNGKPATAPAPAACRKRHSLALTMRLSACLDAFTSAKEQPKHPTTAASTPTAVPTAFVKETTIADQAPDQQQPQPATAVGCSAAKPAATITKAVAMAVTTTTKKGRRVHFASNDQLTKQVERSTTLPEEKAQYHYSRRELQEMLADARREADHYAAALMLGNTPAAGNGSGGTGGPSNNKAMINVNNSILTGYGNAIASYQPEGTIMQQGFLLCAEKSGFFHPRKRFYCLFKSDRSFCMYPSVQEATQREHLKQHFLVTQVQDYFTSSMSSTQDRKSFMLIKISGEVVHFEADTLQTKQQWIRALVKLVGNVNFVPLPCVSAAASSQATSPSSKLSTTQAPTAGSLAMTLQPLKVNKPTVWKAKQQHLSLTKPHHASLVQGESSFHRSHAGSDNNGHAASIKTEEDPHQEEDTEIKVV